MKSREDYISENLSGLTDFLRPDEYFFYMDVISQMFKEYAKEVSKEALKNASENATLDYKFTPFEDYTVIVNKQSILNESNIPNLD